MNIKLKFKTFQKNELLVFKTKKYFVEQGFKMYSFENDNLVFKKGNDFINMYTFNPLKLKSEVIISFKNKSFVSAQFEINTKNQLITQTEQMVWDEFIKNYKKCILSNNTFTEQNKINVENSIKMSWILFLKIIGVVIVTTTILLIFFAKFN